MGAVKQQGVCLFTLLVGFTALSAGLVKGGGLGIVVALIGAALLIYSFVGFARIKHLGAS